MDFAKIITNFLSWFGNLILKVCEWVAIEWPPKIQAAWNKTVEILSVIPDLINQIGDWLESVRH